MAEQRALYLGIDAGASKTVCLLGDSNQVLGRGIAGSGNPNVVGLIGFASAVRAAAVAAFADARLDRTRVIRAWLGVAGVRRHEASEPVRAAAVEALAADETHVSHDARLILAAARVPTGVALVAGTGSTAYGVGPEGAEAIVGGWGYVFGDEGSGYELGRLGLRAVSQAADGRGPETMLTPLLLNALRIDHPSQLSERLFPAPTAPEVAALAPLILKATTEGDAVAGHLIDDAVAALAAMVRACATALRLPPTHEVVVAGGLVSDGSPVLPALAAALGRPAFHVSRLDAEPSHGALELARMPPKFGRLSGGDQSPAA